jgi:hypothetical protein
MELIPRKKVIEVLGKYNNDEVSRAVTELKTWRRRYVIYEHLPTKTIIKEYPQGKYIILED